MLEVVYEQKEEVLEQIPQKELLFCVSCNYKFTLPLTVKVQKCPFCGLSENVEVHKENMAEKLVEEASRFF
tara:strand:+ start:248 stop:460 length:213 start_codon:yes stop_codon:yes gene_type:complete